MSIINALTMIQWYDDSIVPPSQASEEVLTCTECGKSVPSHKKWSLYRRADIDND